MHFFSALQLATATFATLATAIPASQKSSLAAREDKLCGHQFDHYLLEEDMPIHADYAGPRTGCDPLRTITNGTKVLSKIIEVENDACEYCRVYKSSDCTGDEEIFKKVQPGVFVSDAHPKLTGPYYSFEVEGNSIQC